MIVARHRKNKMDTEKEKNANSPDKPDAKESGETQKNSSDASEEKKNTLAKRSGQRPAFPFKRKNNYTE